MQNNFRRKSIFSNIFKIIFKLAIGLSLIYNCELLALPDMNQVVHGSISTAQNAEKAALQINQNSDKAILNWNSFNIATRESVHFQQPIGGICLNRIDAAQGISQINGSLSATAKIFLINQAGILFGDTAQVNVGGIVASSIDIANDNFIKNKFVFDQPSTLAGVIINKGTINVADYGLAALLGSNVSNDGVIQAKMSSINLASGSSFTLDFYGNQIVNFEVNNPATKSGVDAAGKPLTTGVNVAGEISNDGGVVLITGKAAQGVFDNLINMDGVIRAKSVVDENGAILLLGDEAGRIQVAGNIDATGTLEGTLGGEVIVIGGDIAIDEAILNASGHSGGGYILLGDLPEYSVSPVSKNVRVGANVILNVDAISEGDAGSINISSDLETKFLGKASARGGAISGNGGFVDLSSSGNLIYDEKLALVDTTAAHGETGTLLFDPRFLIVQTSGGSSYFNNLNNTYGNNASGTNILTPSSIVTAAQLNNIKLQANSDVIFVDALSIPYNGKTLTVNAGRSVLINNNITTTNGTIIVTANDNTATSAQRLTTSTGNPSGDTETVTGNIIMASGTTVNPGTAALSMTIGTSVTSPYTPGSISLDNVNGTNVTLTTPNSVTVAGNISVSNTLTVDVGSASSISGVISGIGALTKKGAGTLTLNSVNTYTGLTNINAGVLQAGIADTIAVSSGVILTNAASAILDLNSFNQTIRSLSGGGATGGNINLGSATLTALQINANTYSGVISGSGGLTKTGGATLTLSGVNTYTGPTNINVGSLRSGVANTIASSSSVNLANTAGAVFELNNLSQNLTALSGGGASGGNVNLGSATLTVTGNTNSTYAGIISGNGALTKTGTGILTLTGINTYTGATTINAGTLKAGIANSIANSSPIAIANTAGATFDLNNFNQAISTLAGGGSSGGSINLGTATLFITQGATNTFAGVISGAGNITKGGNSTLILSGANTYTGTTTINTGTLQAGAAGIIANSDALVLANTTGAVFDLNNFNQTVGSLSGGGVSGGNINLGSATLTVQQAVANSYSGIISGSGGIAVNNTATLTLNGANTYAGATTINGGILQAGAANVFPSSTALTLANNAGATFALNNFNQSIGAISGGGAAGGNISLGSATLTIAQTTDQTYAGVISGTGNVTKNGSATLTLSGTNTYTGTTNINAGTVRAGAVNVIVGPVTLANTVSATFDLNNFSQSIGTLAGGGSTGGNITLGNATLTVNQATANNYAGIISGTGNLTTNGTATLTLSGANTYTGVTSVNAGTLQAGAMNVVPATSPFTLSNTASAVFDLNGFDQVIGGLWGAGTTGGNIVLGSGNLTITQDAFGTYGGVISGSGNVILANTSNDTLVLTGANTFTGGMYVYGGALKVTADNNLGAVPGVATANLLNINGGNVEAAASFAINTNRGITLGSYGGTVQVNPSFTLTYDGIVAGNGALTKTGAGTLLLSGVNTYTGATNVVAGSLQTGVANSIANSSALSLNNTAGATFNLNGFDQNVGTLSAGGATGGNINLGNATLTVNQGSANNYAGAISGTGNVVIGGPARLTLSGANTYTGTTTVNGGTLQAGVVDVITTSNALILANTTGAVFDLNNLDQNIGSLGGGGASGGNITLGTASLTVNQTASNTFAGIISGAGGLTSTGPATLTLSGSNTFTGATNVNSGTLQAGAVNVIAGSSALTLANSSGATFDLNNFDQSVSALVGGGITGGNVNLGTATLRVNQNVPNTYAGIISGAGDLVVEGSATLNLTGANTYSGTTLINAGTLQAGAVNVIPSASALVLANTAGATFDLNDFDQEIGSLAGGGSTGGNVTLGTATLSVDQGIDSNFSGVISGVGGLTVDGTAILNLSGTNTYTGPTTINSGTLQAGAINVLSPSSPVILADSATALFDLNDFNQTIGSLSGGGTTGGNIALGHAVLLINQTTPATYAGVISGTGNVVLSTGSTSTLTLAGTNTYTGSTSVRAGNLSVNTDANLGAAPGVVTTNAVNLNGGTLEVGASFTLDQNRGVTLGASGGSIQVDPTFTLTYNGVVAGNGPVNKTGTGTLVLGGENTYTGATTITAGSIQTAITDAIATTSSVIMTDSAGTLLDLNGFDQTIGTLSGGGTTGGNITLGNATLSVIEGTASTYAGVISGTGGLTKDGSETLTLTGNNTYTGTTFVKSGSLKAGAANVISSLSPVVLANVSGPTFDLNSFNQSIGTLSGGGATGGNIALGSATLTVNQNAPDNYSGIISGPGGLAMNGSAMLTLNGYNTYTGVTTVSAGTLQAGAANVIANTSMLNLADDATAVFDLNYYDQAIGGLSGGGASGGNISLGNANLTVNQSSNDTYAGIISDFGSGSVTLNGSATLTLTGANTYFGATVIDAGTLQAGATDVIANSELLLLSNVAGAAFDLNNFDQKVGTLSGGGGAGGNITLGTANLTVDQNFDSDFAGSISGTGNIVKNGLQMLTLDGVNAYTGSTTIGMGTLQAGAVNTISTSSPINISAGSLFDLNSYNQDVNVLSGVPGTGTNVKLGSAILTMVEGYGLSIEP